MKIITIENWHPDKYQTNRKMKLRQSTGDQPFFAVDRPMGASSELTMLNRKHGIPFSRSPRLFEESPTSVLLKKMDIAPIENLDKAKLKTY